MSCFVIRDYRHDLPQTLVALRQGDAQFSVFYYAVEPPSQ